MSTELNGVTFQGFHWFLKEDSFPSSKGRKLWQFLGEEATHYRDIGIDAVWIPPAYKAAFNRTNVDKVSKFVRMNHPSSGATPLIFRRHLQATLKPLEPLLLVTLTP